MGRKITQYPNNVSVTPDELSLLDLSEKTGVAVYESRKWTLSQFKTWLNANLTIPSIDGTQGQIPLFVQDDVIGSNTRFTFIDNEGTEVGFRFSDSAGNLTQAGVTYLNVESQGIASNSVLRLANWADNANKGIVTFRKSRGTKTSPSKVLAGDVLGHFIYSGQTSWGTGSTTAIVEVVAKTNYDITDDGFGNYQRYGLTEFRIYLAPDTSFNNIPSGFANNLAFSVDGNGLVKFLNYAFPIADGTLNQVLTTNGAGQLTWANPSSGVSGSGTLNRVAKWTPNGTQLGNSHIYDDTLVQIKDDSGNLRFELNPDNGTTFFIFGNSSMTYRALSNELELQSVNNTAYVSLYHASDTGWQHIRFRRTMGNGGKPTLGKVLFSMGHLELRNIQLVATENHSSLAEGAQLVLGGTANGTFVSALTTLILTQDNKAKISNAYYLPNTDGTNGQVLVTDGAGNVSWTTPSSTSDFIPRLQGIETFRGVTHRNNSVTYDTYGGITMNITGAQFAKSVATNNFQSKQVVSSYQPTSPAVGAYGCIRGANALHASGAGFYFVCDYGIADTAYAPNTHNFVGLTTSTTALAIGGSGNGQPSAITSTFLAMANDSTDANMQIMYRNISNQLIKIDLGANFPSNRSASVPANGIYRVEFYNFSSSSLIRYRVTHYTTTNGTFEATGFLTDLNYLDLLTFQVGRSMGTQLGGVTNSAIFVVGRCGIYNV